MDEKGEQHQSQAPQASPLDTVGAKLVALMPEAPNSIDASGSALVAPADHLVTRLVAPVSPQTIPGFIDPSADVVGSGADVVDGDDPHWGPRAA